jgi:hypothetical protein
MEDPYPVENIDRLGVLMFQTSDNFGPFGPLHLTPEDQQTEKGGKIFISHPSDPQVEIILPQVTIEKPQNARKTSNSNMNISAVKNQHQHQTRMHPTRAL